MILRGQQTVVRSLGLMLLTFITGPAFAASIIKVNPNLEAVKAAMDTAKSPPIAEVTFPLHHDYPQLGGPGPYFPERAERYGLGGVAVLQCKLASTGALSSCSVLADGPTDFAFGLASLRMAERGYMKATPQVGLADESFVRIVVIFPKPPKNTF
jgi:hypothetical protein